VQGAVFRVQDAGFRVQGPGSRVQGSGFMIQGAVGVWALGFSDAKDASNASLAPAPRHQRAPEGASFAQKNEKRRASPPCNVACETTRRSMLKFRCSLALQGARSTAPHMHRGRGHAPSTGQWW